MKKISEHGIESASSSRAKRNVAGGNRTHRSRLEGENVTTTPLRLGRNLRHVQVLEFRRYIPPVVVTATPDDTAICAVCLHRILILEMQEQYLESRTKSRLHRVRKSQVSKRFRHESSLERISLWDKPHDRYLQNIKPLPTHNWSLQGQTNTDVRACEVRCIFSKGKSRIQR
jgi:hypothetical protein